MSRTLTEPLLLLLIFPVVPLVLGLVVKPEPLPTRRCGMLTPTPLIRPFRVMLGERMGSYPQSPEGEAADWQGHPSPNPVYKRLIP